MGRPNTYEGKAALITGGGSGIGRATALLMASEGAAIGVADIRPDRAAAVADETRTAGLKARALTCDVTVPADSERAVADVVQAFGSLGVPVTSDGIGEGRDVVDIPQDRLDVVLDLDLRSAILSSEYAVPRMRASGGGAIVHISSIHGVRCYHGSVLCALKAGIIGLT
jgi:NAD(P)-dependent dehydrogenase (short-subunit alcohol dehydrogenase family)